MTKQKILIADDEAQIREILRIYFEKEGFMPINKEVSKEELKKINILYKDIENTFQGFFGTKVKMAPGKKKGKIIIEYASNDDLERILNLMK